MAHMVLGIGYHSSEYTAVRNEWRPHNIDFHFIGSIKEASQCLRQQEYLCVTISTNITENLMLDEMHGIQSIPIIVLSPEIEISKRAESFQHGVLEYILTDAQRQEVRANGNDAIEYYLNSPNKGSKPLTVITMTDIFVCVEHRSVEVRGQRIDLTSKEFDILALLIARPKHVFQYGTIYESVWHEREDHYSQKLLANHMSNLRNKLRIQPDIPNYVVSIRNIGYKFDPE